MGGYAKFIVLGTLIIGMTIGMFSSQGESMSAQFLFAAVIPAKITCSR